MAALLAPARTPRAAELRALETKSRVVITLREDGRAESSYPPDSPLPRPLEQVMDVDTWRGLMRGINCAQRWHNVTSHWSGRLYAVTLLAFLASWVVSSGFTARGIPHLWARPIRKSVVFLSITTFFFVLDYLALKSLMRRIDALVESSHCDGASRYLVSAVRQCGYVCAIFIDVPPGRRKQLVSPAYRSLLVERSHKVEAAEDIESGSGALWVEL